MTEPVSPQTPSAPNSPTVLPPDPGLPTWVWRWFSSSFLNHFLAYLLLPVALLLLLAMLGNAVGESVGMDKQIWHDDPWKQFFVGASLMVACVQVFLVGYLLWLRDRRDRPWGKDFPEISFGRYAWQLVAALLGTALVVFLATFFMYKGAHPDMETLPLGIKDSPTSQEEDSAYAVPWLLLLTALAGGFAV